MPESASERTEEATDKRKREARLKGTVARSADLTNASVMIAMLMVMPVALSKLGEGSIQVIKESLGTLRTDGSLLAISNAFYKAASPMIAGLVLLVGSVLAVSLIANIAQVGLVFSPEAMVPNFNKLNPAEGFKRLVSGRAVFEVSKATIKLVLFAFLAWGVVAASWPAFGNLAFLSTYGALQYAGGALHTAATRIIIVWTVLAATDYFYQRQQISKGLKMTKDEIKREFKEADGNPETKAARASRRNKMRKGRIADAVKNASVVITNPTHYAIALEYSDASPAPIVVAKGKDFIAAKIREFASENGVPIVPNPPLARALYRECEVGDYVPGEMFQAVAEVLAYVYRTIGDTRQK